MKSWPGDVVFGDFTHPNAADWWFNEAKEFHDLIPFDGLWAVTISIILFMK